MNERKLLMVVVGQFVVVTALVALVVVQLGAKAAVVDQLEKLRNEQLSVRYEYKVMTVSAGGLSRTGADAMKQTVVDPSEKELTKVGSDGWELVGSYLELETAYPNFGDDKYVTGLQPNIRPQRLVLVLRRRVG